ncbi:hypothetical protein V3G39_03005 [Dermatophilaceae bacterium Sec6.4]
MVDAPTLAEAVDRLYAVEPAAFVRTRAALAADAKAAGAGDLVREVRALRKPTAAAYLVNVLARGWPQELAGLAQLGERLRSAQSRLDGAAMKELSVERVALLTHLTDAACGSGDRVSPAVREQVTDTFTAALADPAAQAAVTGGALVTALRYNGFGEVDLSDAVATPLRLIRGGPVTATDGESSDGRRLDAERELVRKATIARLARAQATLERAGQQAEAAGQARDRAEKHLVEARTALQKAEKSYAEAERNRTTAQADVAKVSATRQALED